MRTGILRAVLLSLWASSLLCSANGQGHDALLAVHAGEGRARLALKEKGSIFSIELSADTVDPVPATITVRILAPDDKLLAETSRPVRLRSAAQRIEVPLTWSPADGLQDI